MYMDTTWGVNMKTKQRNRFKNCDRLYSMGMTDEQIAARLSVFCARNKEYWIERGFDEKDAITMSRSKMPGTFEYYTIFKGLPASSGSILVSDFQNTRKNTLSNFVKKHGEKEGGQRFKSYCDKQAYSNTLEYMIENYGESEGIEKYYTANKMRAVTLDNLTEKHGVAIGTKIYNEYVSKQRINGKTLGYFVEKYGEKQGREIYEDIGKRKSLSYEGFLLRNDGDVEKATEEFEIYCQRRYESNILRAGVSKSSQDFFRKLHAELRKIEITGIYYASFNQEWGINVVGKRFVYLDFFCRSRGKVIEFYGDYYHANPLKFQSSDIIKCFGGIKAAATIWSDDADRIRDIKTVSYVKDVLVIWSSEVENNEMEAIQKCLKFLLA